MPPKVKKSYIFCHKCKVNITSKDEEVHLKQCPPSLNNWSHPFIIHNKVFCNLEIKSTDNINGLSIKQLNDCVFLSRSIIEMSGLAIGDEVIVDVLGKEMSLVKTVWPTTERPVISALLTRKVYDLICKSSDSVKVTISKLSPPALPAMEIFLDPISSVNDDVKFDLNIFLQRNYINKVINVKNKFLVDFFGKTYKFKINNILPYEVESPANVVRSLELDLEKLNISSEISNPFYRILENTKWHFDAATQETEKNKDYFENIGGIDSTITELREILKLALGRSFSIPGLKLSRGILLYGTTGSGKTTIAKALAAESSAYLLTINGPEIYSKYFGETESKLKDIFNDAFLHSPSIILMDEIDSLCPVKGSGGSDQEKRVVTTLLTLLDGLHTGNGNVVVLATTSKLESLDPALRRCGRFDREIEIPVPNPNNRFDILSKLLSKTPHKLTDNEIMCIAKAAHGFVGADLSSLCTQSAMCALKRSEGPGERVEIIRDDFQWALTQVKPSAMREVIIEVPDVKWSDIGGQSDLKLKLKQAVEWPLKHPESFERLGITPPRGILMFGPPGCSKTMIAKALANESKLNFISIKGPELFSKWVGSSERAVRDVFKKARQVAPSIIFFDEIDALGGERGSQGSGSNVQERVLAQILTELDGVSPLGNVTVVAATNRPDRIDKALLRPGRLDRIVYVPLPDVETRREILRIKLSKMPVASCVDLEELVERTHGYSGAEVQAVCHEAALKALEDDLQAEEVKKSHFETSLKMITPRTPPSLIKLYEDYLTQT